MELTQQAFMDSMADAGYAGWLRYLRGLAEGEEGQSAVALDVLFHFAAPKGTRGSDLGWAEVAIRAAELDALWTSGPVREGALWRAMNLRARFIAEMGVKQGDAVLDSTPILSWISSEITMPLATIGAQAASLWEDLPKARQSSDPDEFRRWGETLRKLRRIRHRVELAKILAESRHFTLPSELEQLLELHGKLP